MYKILSTIEVSQLSAATGIGNVMEIKVARFDDVIIVLRMGEEEMVSVQCLSRIAEYFGVSQEDVILGHHIEGIEVSVMGQEMFKYYEQLEDDYVKLMKDVKPEPACCGTGGCPGCPSAKE